jgi:hypothetical protein
MMDLCLLQKENKVLLSQDQSGSKKNRFYVDKMFNNNEV